MARCPGRTLALRSRHLGAVLPFRGRLSSHPPQFFSTQDLVPLTLSAGPQEARNPPRQGDLEGGQTPLCKKKWDWRSVSPRRRGGGIAHCQGPGAEYVEKEGLSLNGGTFPNTGLLVGFDALLGGELPVSRRMQALMQVGFFIGLKSRGASASSLTWDPHLLRRQN